jgi:demethylmenaquinone methyltransferase/2-methoxy-6-polyprenyl-1,4-benzoquinol methylase
LDTEQVAAFFNRLAPNWDTSHSHNADKIERILDYADIRPRSSILDVGCGTGILFPFYLNRDVSLVTGVDLSSGMIARAREKYPDPRIQLIIGDAAQLQLGTFDRCVVYSALPHFKNAAKLIAKLSLDLKQNGRLTVAHSESREMIDQRHNGSAHDVSVGLMPASELELLFSPFFHVDTIIDNDEMYIVSGIKK